MGAIVQTIADFSAPASADPIGRLSALRSHALCLSAPSHPRSYEPSQQSLDLYELAASAALTTSLSAVWTALIGAQRWASPLSIPRLAAVARPHYSLLSYLSPNCLSGPF